MANMTGLSYYEMARATAEEKQELHSRHPLLRWTKSSLEAFAQHWGNYETRRLMDNALLGIECDGKHADAVAAAFADLGLPSAGAALAVPGTLGRMFTAVGLLERFDETLLLLSDLLYSCEHEPILAVIAATLSTAPRIRCSFEPP